VRLAALLDQDGQLRERNAAYNNGAFSPPPPAAYWVSAYMKLAHLSQPVRSAGRTATCAGSRRRPRESQKQKEEPGGEKGTFRNGPDAEIAEEVSTRTGQYPARSERAY